MVKWQRKEILMEEGKRDSLWRKTWKNIAERRIYGPALTGRIKCRMKGDLNVDPFQKILHVETNEKRIQIWKLDWRLTWGKKIESLNLCCDEHTKVEEKKENIDLNFEITLDRWQWCTYIVLCSTESTLFISIFGKQFETSFNLWYDSCVKFLEFLTTQTPKRDEFFGCRYIFSLLSSVYVFSNIKNEVNQNHLKILKKCRNKDVCLQNG